MAYNKKEHLRDNIDAIKTAFSLEREQRRATPQERSILERYSGFGAIKAILNPAATPADALSWSKSEIDLFLLVSELHQTLREASKDEAEYKRYISSLKNSILTAFYTPPRIVEVLADTLRESGIIPNRLLDPSAGTGVFISAFKQPGTEITCFEKDLLTGKILTQLYPDEKVRIEGFENVEARYTAQFDLVTSNIPFGDVGVFDPVFHKLKDPAYKLASQTIHNYFFMKGVDSVRIGGIVAFITSQGVLNSEQNRPVREWLMEQCTPVSTIRLPNNLFSENAGTEVGSDLIILQRKKWDDKFNDKQHDFIESRKLSNGISINNSFQTFNRVVHTRSKVDTDPYGKPAMTFLHDGGIEGMASDLGKMLHEDFAQHLDLEQYQHHAPQMDHSISQDIGYKPTVEDWQQMGEMIALTQNENPEILEPQPEDFIRQSTANGKPEISIQENPQTSFAFDLSAPATKSALAKEPTLEAIQQPLNLQQEPILTLYDLFGFSQEERSQIKQPRRKSKTKQQPSKEGRDLFSGIPPQETPTEREVRLKQEQQIREDRLKPIAYTKPLLSHHREGSLISGEDNRIGYLHNMDGLQPMFHPLDLSTIQRQKASLFIEIRDTYHHLYKNEAERLEANPALREMLNRLYDDFAKRFGQLNDAKNLDLIKMDAGGKEILSLERYMDGKAVKADIFNHPVAFNPNEITHVDNAREALTASLNKYGSVDLDYMARLIDSQSENILDELKGAIYYNPLIGGYEVADKFISGNVISKAEQVNDYLERNPGHEAARESLEALRQAIPKPIAFDDLDFNFGERWIPTGIYNKYASHLFDTDVTIHFAQSRDEYSVKAAGSNAKIRDQYAVKAESRSFDGIALMKHALQNTSPDITKKIMVDGKETRIRDSDAIQLANSKIDEMRSGFSDWLREQSPEFKDRLENLYNRTFNCFVRPNYDGSHQTFPDLDLKGLGIDDLYNSQKDAIWMLKLNNGGICDHEVGGGKTLIMCCGAYEMKRLGLVNKPMIVGLKANIHEIAQTFCTAYPNARVLYPGKEDFTPANRVRIFNEMKNNAWDAIIMTHEQFGMIPQSPEIQKEILQKELDSVEENLDVIRNNGGEVSRGMEKGMLKRQQNLEAKLKSIAHDIAGRKDDTVDFRLMGIDHLFVDESHKFKNLTFTTRHDRVAGLGNSDGSQRALNMLFALRTIQERTGKDLGATFLSGTTISNSLTELYYSSNTCVQKNWNGKALIHSMLGQPFSLRKPLTMNFR